MKGGRIPYQENNSRRILFNEYEDEDEDDDIFEEAEEEIDVIRIWLKPNNFTYMPIVIREINDIVFSFSVDALNTIRFSLFHQINCESRTFQLSNQLVNFLRNYLGPNYNLISQPVRTIINNPHNSVRQIEWIPFTINNQENQLVFNIAETPGFGRNFFWTIDVFENYEFNFR